MIRWMFTHIDVSRRPHCAVHHLRQLPRIKIPAPRVLSYPLRALVLARLPKSSGGDDERTAGTAPCHHQGRGPEIDRGQEKGVSSPSGFGLPQRQCSASRSRVWLVPQDSDPGTARTADRHHLCGQYVRPRQSQNRREMAAVGGRYAIPGGTPQPSRSQVSIPVLLHTDDGEGHAAGIDRPEKLATRPIALRKYHREYPQPPRIPFATRAKG